MNDGIAATAAIKSYVISVLLIVEFGPDIEAIKVSYMCSGMLSIDRGLLSVREVV